MRKKSLSLSRVGKGGATGLHVRVILHFTGSKPVANEVASEQGTLTAENIKRMQNVRTDFVRSFENKEKRV